MYKQHTMHAENYIHTLYKCVSTHVTGNYPGWVQVMMEHHRVQKIRHSNTTRLPPLLLLSETCAKPGVRLRITWGCTDHGAALQLGLCHICGCAKSGAAPHLGRRRFWGDAKSGAVPNLGRRHNGRGAKPGQAYVLRRRHSCAGVGPGAASILCCH